MLTAVTGEFRDLFLTQTEIAPDTLSDAVRYVTERGVRAIINVSPYVDLPDDVIAAADPMIIHQADVSLLEATGAKPKSLLVTRGKAGITWDGVDYSGVMVPDPEVVDTIGAGDAFVGTLAGALAQGRDRRAAGRGLADGESPRHPGRCCARRRCPGSAAPRGR